VGRISYQYFNLRSLLECGYLSLPASWHKTSKQNHEILSSSLPSYFFTSKELCSCGNRLQGFSVFKPLQPCCESRLNPNLIDERWHRIHHFNSPLSVYAPNYERDTVPSLRRNERELSTVGGSPFMSLVTIATTSILELNLL
jgi:hypothetical protein